MVPVDSSARRALVIGVGSIGTRHETVLRELGCAVRTLSRRPGVGDYETYAHAVESFDPMYVVVATETAARQDNISDLLDGEFTGDLLIEKPVGEVSAELDQAACRVWIGYNLRFHPLVAAFRRELDGCSLLTVQARVGQYLPDWRPGRDYRTTASNRAGGGVLRDLSHEIDLLEWLVGPCVSVSALIGRSSALGLEVEDSAAMLMEFRKAPLVSLEMNYLDRPVHRSIIATTDDHTVECNLADGQLLVDGAVVLTAAPERNDTYLAMHRAVLSGETQDVCSLQEGRRTMRILESIEESAATRGWVRP